MYWFVRVGLLDLEIGQVKFLWARRPSPYGRLNVAHLMIIHHLVALRTAMPTIGVESVKIGALLGTNRAIFERESDGHIIVAVLSLIGERSGKT